MEFQQTKFVIITAACLRGKNNELVVKELAIGEIEDKNEFAKPVKIQSFLFESPYEWNQLPLAVRATNHWIV